MPLLLWLWLLLAQRNTLTVITGEPDPRANEIALRDVHVQLSIRDGKTTFRSGEPIRLVMSVTADQPGYSVDPVHYSPLPVSLEDVSISPDTGLFRWLQIYSQPDGVFRDYGSSRALSERATEIIVALNWWVRFDEAGDYTVRTSTPISSLRTRGVKVISNPVTFHVTAMSDADEDAEVRRLRARIETSLATTPELPAEPCEDLAFLSGDAAAREKADLVLHPAPQLALRSNCGWSLRQGFYISRNSRLIASQLEQLLKDNNATLSSGYIDDVVNFRIWAEMPAFIDKTQGDMSLLRRLKRERSAVLRREYVEDIASHLMERPPAGRLRAALEMTKGRDPMPRAVRDILVDEFESLSTREQSSLVLLRWQELDAPVLVLPVLRNILARTDRSRDDPDRSSALNALSQISPVEGHSLLIAEILDKRLTTIPQTIRLPKPCVLPEIDRPLITQLAELAASKDAQAERLLDLKASWLARCGAGAAQTEARRLYDDERVGVHAKAYLLGYLAKWNQTQARPLIDQAVGATAGNDDDFLWRLTDVAYSPAIDAWLRVRLESDDAATASRAAMLLAEHGPPETRRVLETRLARWMKDWGNRASGVEPAEGESILGPSQSNLQATLILCVIHGASWKLSDAEAFALRRTCVTVSCRQIADSR